MLVAHVDLLGGFDAGSPVLSGRSRPPTWLLWVIVAVAGVLGLICLRWATAQVTRVPPVVRWRARPAESDDRIDLHAAAVTRPVADDLRSCPGVRSAVAWLSGPARSPELFLVVTAEPDADIGALRARVLDHAVPRLRQALETENVSVAMELRFVGRGTRSRQPTGPSTRST